MNNSSGVSSYGFSNQYTFSNLPSFITSRKSTDKKESLAETGGEAVELPFIPTRRFPVNEDFFSRLPSGPDRVMPNEGRRVWSAGSEGGKLFSERRRFVEKGRGKGEGKKNEVDEVDAGAEFFKLGQNLVCFVCLLGKKSGLWVLWALNVVFQVLVGKMKSIPDPQFVKEEGEENCSGTFAESTPVKSKENPLFEKKLRGIKESLQEKLGSDEKRVEEKYGTHFFDKPNKGVNLEASFMKVSMGEEAIVKEEDLYSKAKSIRNDLLKFSEIPEEKVIKPLFTRSTKRFEDLEWLVDDSEDYLNNLETTRLYQEYQKILAERKKMRQLVEISKMKESAPVKGLRREQVLEVEEVWEEPGNGSLIKKYGINIERRDILTLADRHWLNDNIIDFYMQLIKDEIDKRKWCTMHVFSTFFFTNLKSRGYDSVRRWAKRAKIDVSQIDYIFIPMNLNGTHWALSVVDNKNERFLYIDSLNSDGIESLLLIANYMKEETKRLYGDGMNGKNYDLYKFENCYECPGQENGFDCGVFTCTAVDYIARGVPLSYSQKDMPVIRRRMAWEIMHGRLDH